MRSELFKPYDEDAQTIIEEMKASEKTPAAKHCVHEVHVDEEQLPVKLACIHTILVLGLVSALSVILLEKHYYH